MQVRAHRPRAPASIAAITMSAMSSPLAAGAAQQSGVLRNTPAMPQSGGHQIHGRYAYAVLHGQQHRYSQGSDTRRGAEARPRAGRGWTSRAGATHGRGDQELVLVAGRE